MKRQHSGTLRKWDVFILIVMLLSLTGVFASIYIWIGVMHRITEYQTEVILLIEEYNKNLCEVTKQNKEITTILLEVIEVFK